MSYDPADWDLLIAECPDLEDTPEERRAATLAQAFGVVSAVAMPDQRPDHDWRKMGYPWYECARCHTTRRGDLQFATSGETWTIAPRHAGRCAG